MPAAASTTSVPRRHSPWGWVVVASGVLGLGALFGQGVNGWRAAGGTRVVGWSATPISGAWHVRALTRGAPAADRLRVGDRVLALDGDVRVARLGPDFALQQLAPGVPYALTVERGSDTLAFPLAIGTRTAAGWQVRLGVYLLIALAYVVVGLFIGFARSDDRTARYAWGTCLATAVFLMWVSTSVHDGTQRDPLSRWLALSFPLHLIGSYLFFNVFPHPVPQGRRWRALTVLVLAVGALCWLGQCVGLWLESWPTSRVHAFYDGPGRGFWQYWTFVRPAFRSLLVFTIGALDFVMVWRNYRSVPGANDRRRILLAVAGQGVAILPGFTMALLAGLAQLADPTRPRDPNVANQVMLANASLVLAPVTLAIAIVRNRVLGIHLVIRLGIKYLLAQNVVRAAFLLPLAWLVGTLVLHREQTLAQLLFSRGSGVNLALIGLSAAGMLYRPRIALAIDRRFFREAYQQEQILVSLLDQVKPLTSRDDITPVVSREIERSLHPARVVILYRDPTDGWLRPNESHEDRDADAVPPDSPLLEVLERDPTPQGMTHVGRALDRLGRRALPVRSDAPTREPGAPTDLPAPGLAEFDLVVPMLGVDRRVIGLLLLGGKRSEEPYTHRDRSLLRMVANQIAAIHEVLLLRQTVGRQRVITHEVLGRLGEQGIQLMLECPHCGTCYDAGTPSCERDGSALALTLPIERVVDGRYRLEKLIGKGGMGTVYEATDLRLRRIVAFKVLTGAASSPSALKRFEREAQVTSRIDHPSIVPVYDFGELGNQSAFFIMQRVEGRTWRSALQHPPGFDRALAAELLGQLCDGVSAAHAAGLLHRDLKPDNLIIEPARAGRGPLVRILDFGLAKLNAEGDSSAPELTAAGVTMGTWGYMSPEQAMGLDVDERTDLYSLGVIALETLTGPLDFGTSRSAPAARRALDERIAALGNEPRETRLAQVLSRAIAEDREARFATVAELRASLLEALRGTSGD